MSQQGIAQNGFIGVNGKGDLLFFRFHHYFYSFTAFTQLGILGVLGIGPNTLFLFLGASSHAGQHHHAQHCS